MGCNCGSSRRTVAGAPASSGRTIYRHYRPDGSYRDYTSQSAANEAKDVAGGKVEQISR